MIIRYGKDKSTKTKELRKKKRKLQQQKSFTSTSVKKTTVKSFFTTANTIKKIQDKQDWHQKTKIKTGILKTKEVSFFNFYKWMDTSFVDLKTGKIEVLK